TADWTRRDRLSFLLPSEAMRQSGPAERAQHFLRISRRGLPEHLVDALPEPLRATLLGRLRQARADDEDVVAAGRQRCHPRAPELAKPSLDPVAGDGAGDGLLRHREAEPGVTLVLAREPIQRQEPRRSRAAAPIDGVEVPRSREAVAALHPGGAPTRRGAYGRVRGAA